MIVALTGATGFVGGHTLRMLADRGHDVRALTRREQPDRDHVTWISGSLEDQAALDTLCAGADVVLHIAGVVNAPDKAGFDRANIGGTEAMLSSARSGGVTRFVHVSSLAAREPGLSDYGASKRGGEDRITASELDWTVVRPPGVYGPADTEMFETFRLANSGFAPMPPKGRVSLIHAEDLARLLVALVEDETGISHHAIYAPDDGTPGGWDHIDFAHLLGRALGKKVRSFNAPASLLKFAARADEMVRGKKAKLTRDRARYLAHPDWTVGEEHRPPASLWQPEYSTEAGVRQTADWYRANGWLS